MNKILKDRRKGKRKTSWTKKDTRTTVLISLAMVILMCIPYFGGFDFLKEKQLEEFGGNTEGLVLNVKDNEYNNQGYHGGWIEVVSYTVKYSYTVRGKEYIQNHTFPNDGKYKIFRRSLYKGKRLSIAFKIDQPEKSAILRIN